MSEVGINLGGVVDLMRSKYKLLNEVGINLKVSEGEISVNLRRMIFEVGINLKISMIEISINLEK